MSEPAIRVGLSVSLSGRFQLQGRQALDGVRLWLSYANAHGGISLADGLRPIRLVWYDDGSHAGRTRENILRLIRNDNVHILLGPYSSGLTMAAARIAEEHSRIIWNYGGTSDEIFRQGWRYVVAVSSPASDYLRGLPHLFAKEHKQLSRICIFHSRKGSFARQVARGAMESAQETGHLTQVVPFDTPLENADTISAPLLGMRPDVVVLAGNFQDELAIMRTRPRWPRTVGAIAAVAAGIAEFATQLGKIADDVVGPSQWEPEVSLPATVGPSCDWFVDGFQKQFRGRPDYVAAGSCAAGLIAQKCIHQTGSLDDQKLRRAASGLDCTTFYGRFRIDPRDGKQTGHRITLIRWYKGRKIVLPCT